MTDAYEVKPVPGPVTGSARPPGSKSLTNRALAVAALAEGTSTLTGVLDSQDTRMMIGGLGELGIAVRADFEACTAEVDGCGGRIPAASGNLFLENSGTSIRFLTALCSLGHGTFRLDGNDRMRKRPIVDLVETVGQLGAKASCELGTDSPPVVVEATGLAGGHATIAGNVSSQYLSGLLMAAPYAREAVDLEVRGELVSQPYVDMTMGVMARFGAAVDTTNHGHFVVQPQSYKAIEYDIEPDATAASYFFAVAAVTGGEVTVRGLSRYALQGDVAFVDALEQMGCRVEWPDDGIKVVGGPLRGVDVDMNAISDTAQTMAAVAVFAEGPTRIRNIAHSRVKETDRVAAMVAELRRLGQEVEEFDDGLVIYPRPVTPASVETYDDHRMAMSFALVGLRADGVTILDPGCTRKTYPRFFDDLEALCGQSN